MRNTPPSLTACTRIVQRNILADGNRAGGTIATGKSLVSPPARLLHLPLGLQEAEARAVAVTAPMVVVARTQFSPRAPQSQTARGTVNPRRAIAITIVVARLAHKLPRVRRANTGMGPSA